MSNRLLALICRARGCLCALPVAHVVETMRPLPIEPVGAAPAFVRGLSVIRGVAVPVVDLGALLGAAEAPSTTRFVSLRVGERVVALAVEEIVGVRWLPVGDLPALPPLLRDGTGEAASAVGRLDADLLVVLASARVLPDSVWSALPGGPDEAAR